MKFGKLAFAATITVVVTFFVAGGFFIRGGGVETVSLAAASLALKGQTASLSVEHDTDRPGDDYSDFDLPRADHELCRKACADDSANCRAYTYVKPGVQGSSARCWLKSSVPAGGQSSCCISGRWVTTGKKAGTSATDLSGTWQAVVNSAEGRWDYTMVLSRESDGKWTGEITFTLNGESATTTGTSVESLGGGKLKIVWRPGMPNEQSFDGSYANDKIKVDGYGGQLSFSRQ